MAIKITKDGRTILTGKDYSKFRRDLYEHQQCLCAECGRFTTIEACIDWDLSFHVHHKDGRGMGGSRRDDTLTACEGLCGKCHRIEHNQQ